MGILLIEMEFSFVEHRILFRVHKSLQKVLSSSSHLNHTELVQGKSKQSSRYLRQKDLWQKFVVDHLKASAGKYKIGVVSGGSRPMIEKTLQVLNGLINYMGDSKLK